MMILPYRSLSELESLDEDERKAFLWRFFKVSLLSAGAWALLRLPIAAVTQRCLGDAYTPRADLYSLSLVNSVALSAFALYKWFRGGRRSVKGNLEGGWLQALRARARRRLTRWAAQRWPRSWGTWRTTSGRRGTTGGRTRRTLCTTSRA